MKSPRQRRSGCMPGAGEFAPWKRKALAGADWAVGHSGADRGPKNVGGSEFTRFRKTRNDLSIN